MGYRPGSFHDALYKGFGLYNTEYRTVTCLANKQYFFDFNLRKDLTEFYSEFMLLAGEGVMLNWILYDWYK